MIHSYIPTNRRTILPKLRLWRDAELECAIESGAAFRAHTTSGREIRFRMLSYSKRDQVAEVAELSQSGGSFGEDAPVMKVSFDAILTSEGGWPGFLDITRNRVRREAQNAR